MSNSTDTGMTSAMGRIVPSGRIEGIPSAPSDRIYYDSFDDAIERNRPRIAPMKAYLESLGVKYVM